MMTYIALLRGINVSGQKKINMAQLRADLAELNFSNLRTYIQSGNVIFTAAESAPQQLTRQIAEKIRIQYGFDVKVLVMSAPDLAAVQKNNPFTRNPDKDSAYLHVTFLSPAPAPAHITMLKTLDVSPEEYILEGSSIYLYLPNGYGRTRLNNNFFEKKLKVNATTRNWNTINKLVEMAELQ